MRKSIISLLILAASASASASSQWVRTGLGGGAALSVSANGPFILVRSSGGLFRSRDQGASWSSLPAPEGAFALAAAGTSLFAFPGSGGGGPGGGGNSGVWRSEDSGATWRKPGPGLPDSLAASFAGTRALIPYGRYLLAGSDGHLFRSSDQGATWEAARVVDAEARLVSCLAAIGSELFACTYDGLLRSADSGDTWAFAGGLGRDFPQIVDLAGDGKALLAQGAETAYRTVDTGATWTRLDALPEASFNSLLRVGTRFYATREDAVYASADGGATWSRIGKVGNPVLRLFADGGILYAATYSGGLSLSRDGGATWTGMGMPGGTAVSLCANAGRIFAGLAEDVAIYRSPGRGAEWSPSLPWEENLPALGFPLSGVTAVYGDGERMAARIHTAATGPGRLRLSSDGGVTWITDTSSARFWTLFQAGPRLFADAAFDALGNEQGFYRSDDFGGSWTRISDPLGAQALAGLGPWLLAATPKALLRSDDGGARWTPPIGSPVGGSVGGPVGGPEGVAVLAVGGNDLFAASDTGLYRSADSGRTWESLPGGPHGIRALYAYGSVLFAGIGANPRGTGGTGGTGGLDGLDGPVIGRAADFHGILRSTDRGATWAPVDAGLDPFSVTALMAAGEDLYLGTEGDGVWRRPLAELADGSIALRPRRPARAAYRRSGLRFPGTDAAPPRPGSPGFDANGKRKRGAAAARAGQGVSIIPAGTIH